MNPTQLHQENACSQGPFIDQRQLHQDLLCLRCGRHSTMPAQREGERELLTLLPQMLQNCPLLQNLEASPIASLGTPSKVLQEKAKRFDKLLCPHPLRHLHQSLLRMYLYLPWQRGNLLRKVS